MRISASLPRWVLSQGETLRIRNARGVTMRCRSGRLWITEQGNADDIWLAAGEAHTCTRRGLALVGAEADSIVEFSVAARSPWRAYDRLVGMPWTRTATLRPDQARGILP